MYRHADPSLPLGWSCLRFCAPNTLCTTILLHTARPLNELLCQAPCTAGTSPRRAPPVGQCADGAGPRSHRPGSSRALYFAIFCGSARALGGTGSRSVARLAKYCGLVKRQTGHAFLNAQWVCLLIKFTKQHFICHEKFVCLLTFKLWSFWRNL